MDRKTINQNRRGRRFTRPMPPSGPPNTRTDQLYHDLLRLIDELEREGNGGSGDAPNGLPKNFKNDG